MSRVNDPVRQVLMLELTTTTEPIAGVARSGDQPGHAFSGWSELFAVLQMLTTQAGGAANAPAHRAGDRHAEDTGPDRPV
jgi:hypothetical protein